MTEQEYMLINQLKSAVKNNPALFADAVIMMQQGVSDAIAEHKNHAMQMEKLAFAYGAASTMKHTSKTKDWIDSMICSVEKESKWFQLDIASKLGVKNDP